jgi:F-type H+-transporting ATPase subunit b
MQGLDLIKNLAKLDGELAEKVEDARRSADLRIKRAEAESKRLLAEAEAQIRQMEAESRTQIAETRARLAEDARQRGVTEQERLRSQAGPNLERAVEFILSEVVP